MREALLTPVEAIYAAVVRARNAHFERQAPQRLRWPVVSVGNLSVGGAGKTPLVILLAKLLTQAGWSVDVLSRGYGRAGRGTEQVDAAGDPARFGDEPMMVARSAGAPVFVGASRYEAGLLAEQQPAPGERRVHLLDDGFQHRQLARTVDVVVLQRSDMANRLLPAGRLREPLASLRRADVIVLREQDADLAGQLSPYLKAGVDVWQVRRGLTCADAATSRQRPAMAFCAIARPDEFFAMLKAAGVTLAATRAFRDHHRYTRSDMAALKKLGSRCGAAAFFTTEKDAVKLDAGLRAILSASAPLRVAGLTLELADEPAALARLIAMLDSAMVD